MLGMWPHVKKYKTSKYLKDVLYRMKKELLYPLFLQEDWQTFQVFFFPFKCYDMTICSIVILKFLVLNLMKFERIIYKQVM